MVESRFSRAFASIIRFRRPKGGRKGQAQPTYVEWLKTYMVAGIDAVVITDHNSAEGIEPARQALEDLRGDDAFREIAILAGVEITVAGGSHLLGLFDNETNSQTIRTIIARAGYDGIHGESRTAASGSLSKVAELIHKDGGMAIPAHADKPAGILKQTSTGLAEIESNAPVFAIETLDPATTFERPGFRRLVRLLGSDAHHLDSGSYPEGETAKYPGSHYTWVKMETPSLEGIRNAISDGERSIAPSDGEEIRKPSHPQLRSISFGGTELEFNPWLNTIIGGRGVGKSTAVEFLRLALDRYSEIPENLAPDMRWYSPHKPPTGEKRAWSGVDSIDVSYRKDAHTYRITWCPGNEISAMEQCDGEWAHAPGEVSTRFPARIYSQKQIFEMSRHPQAILDILDASPEVNFPAWRTTYQGLLDRYQETLAAAHTLRDQTQDEERIKGKIQDLERRIESAEKLSESPDVQDLQRIQELSAKTDEAAAQIKSQSDYLAEVVSETQAWAPIDWIPFNAEPRLADALKASNLALSDTAHTLDAAHRRLVGLTARLERERIEADFDARGSSLQRTIAAGAGETSADSVLSDLVDISTWKSELAQERKQLANIQGSKIKLADLEPQLVDQRAKIAASRLELSSLRVAYIESLSDSSPNLKVKLHPMGRDSDLEKSFRRLLNKESTFDATFSNEGLFKGLPDGRSTKFAAKIEELKRNVIAIASGDPAKKFLEDRKIPTRLLDHIRTLSRSELQEIDLWFPDDLVEIRYRSDSTAGWTSISEGSPGQRTAALLAFILTIGTEPLILDQPEDDLENQLISSLIVKTLHSIKENRQVIVVTHNANIVVNANSENVIVLKRTASGAAIRARGALEKQEVREAVCEILEGGEPAFRRRFERLGIKMPDHIGALAK